MRESIDRRGFLRAVLATSAGPYLFQNSSIVEREASRSAEHAGGFETVGLYASLPTDPPSRGFQPARQDQTDRAFRASAARRVPTAGRRRICLPSRRSGWRPRRQQHVGRLRVVLSPGAGNRKAGSVCSNVHRESLEHSLVGRLSIAIQPALLGAGGQTVARCRGGTRAAWAQAWRVFPSP